MMSVLKEINQNVKNIKSLQSSVLARRASQINEELRKGAKKPYQEVTDMCWGDSQRTGVKPLTFVRQVLAACLYPQLMISDKLPVDVIQRAQRLLSSCTGGSLGSYSDTRGLPEIVQRVSEFLMRRDSGAPSHKANIFISPGSQWALMNILKILVNNEGPLRTGVLIPVPCHSITVASLTGLGAVAAPYYQSEEQGWKLHVEELHRALESAKRICNPVSLYIINPGNPSGHVQTRESIEEVIRFASEKKLVLLADEVNQDCVYGETSEFISYKRVLTEMGLPYSDSVELASFHSVSNGLIGECGLRSGYVELVNLDPTVMKHIFTKFSLECAPVTGQIALDLMLNPPQPGEPSFPLYEMETQNIRNMLVRNSKRVFEVLNNLPNFCCQPVEGGSFAFPRLYHPPKAVQRAEEMGMQPDTFYCMRLLEDTGVMVGPGCDYGQKEGTHHISFCIATPEERVEEVLRRMACFHTQFMKDFS